MDIIKASGEKEPFSHTKFCRSVQMAGAPSHVVSKVCGVVEREIKSGISTEELSRKTATYLRQEDVLVAAKYKLRAAIMELGPAGFFFEEYVAAILREYGYEAKVGQMVRGKCVAHEIDIQAVKGNEHFLVEVKYHNRRGLKSDVQVAMYMYARFLDIAEAKHKQRNKHSAWLITNTKFTKKAIQYAECMGIQMTGWRYPKKQGLEQLIENKALYPITVLPSANTFIREQFAQANLMFVRDLLAYSPESLVKKFGLYKKAAKQLIKEAYDLV